MIKKICVIGVGGVGMAHVVATVRSKNKMACIIDINEKILNKAKVEWKNSWNSLVEEVEVDPTCFYSTKLDIIKKLDINLVIIATPPETHFLIINEIRNYYKGDILVEKPISEIKIVTNDKQLYVSSEWIYHSKLKNISEIRNLSMQFTKSCQTKWDNYLISAFDFIPHFLSIIYSKNYRVKDILFDSIDKDLFSGKILTNKNDILIKGSRDNNDGFFVNKNELEWELELFDRQIINGGILVDNIKNSHNILVERVKNETF